MTAATAFQLDEPAAANDPTTQEDLHPDESPGLTPTPVRTPAPRPSDSDLEAWARQALASNGFGDLP